MLTLSPGQSGRGLIRGLWEADGIWTRSYLESALCSRLRLPQRLKPPLVCSNCGAAEAAPLQNKVKPRTKSDPEFSRRLLDLILNEKFSPADHSCSTSQVNLILPPHCLPTSGGDHRHPRSDTEAANRCYRG